MTKWNYFRRLKEASFFHKTHRSTVNARVDAAPTIHRLTISSDSHWLYLIKKV